MKNLLLAVVLPLLAVGCAANPEKTALQTQGINTNGASKVAFQNVRTEANSDGTSTLRGSLRRIGRDPVHFGHLDYTVTDTNGKVLESGQTDYSGAIKQRRSPNASRFSIPLKQAWQPSLQTVAIVWHDKTHQQ